MKCLRNKMLVKWIVKKHYFLNDQFVIYFLPNNRESYLSSTIHIHALNWVTSLDIISTIILYIPIYLSIISLHRNSLFPIFIGFFVAKKPLPVLFEFIFIQTYIIQYSRSFNRAHLTIPWEFTKICFIVFNWY